jgi:hypothetical protein
MHRHNLKNHNPRSLYSIADELLPHDLKRIGVILIQNKVFLKCGICGKDIKKVCHYSIDHMIPRSLGGGDTPENLQHSHDICNFVKSNLPGFVSFYDNPDVVKVYVASDKYSLTLERIKTALENNLEKTGRRPRGGRPYNRNSSRSR